MYIKNKHEKLITERDTLLQMIHLFISYWMVVHSQTANPYGDSSGALLTLSDTGSRASTPASVYFA